MATDAVYSRLLNRIPVSSLNDRIMPRGVGHVRDILTFFDARFSCREPTDKTASPDEFQEISSISVGFVPEALGQEPTERDKGNITVFAFDDFAIYLGQAIVRCTVQPSRYFTSVKFNVAEAFMPKSPFGSSTR